MKLILSILITVCVLASAGGAAAADGAKVFETLQSFIIARGSR